MTLPNAGAGRRRAERQAESTVNSVEHVVNISEHVVHQTERASLSAEAVQRLGKFPAALDTACNRSIADISYVHGYIKEVEKAGYGFLIQVVAEKESFRFGNNGRLVSKQRFSLPAEIGGKLVLLNCSTVQSPGLGMLLGKDISKGLGFILDQERDTLSCRKLKLRNCPVDEMSVDTIVSTLFHGNFARRSERACCNVPSGNPLVLVVLPGFAKTRTSQTWHKSSGPVIGLRRAVRARPSKTGSTGG